MQSPINPFQQETITVYNMALRPSTILCEGLRYRRQRNTVLKHLNLKADIWPERMPDPKKSYGSLYSI